jgi:hypothetical protein
MMRWFKEDLLLMVNSEDCHFCRDKGREMHACVLARAFGILTLKRFL